MVHVRKTLLATTLFVLAGLLVGCDQHSVRLGWVETSYPGHLGASYAMFSGAETRTVPAQAGETLYLEVDAEVERGNLTIEVDDPFGKPIWCTTLCQDCGEVKALPLDQAGCYTISVRGEVAEGGFDLRWEQQ